MRILSAALLAASLLTAFAPIAAAEPQCLEVYPWSKLCEGDVAGFVDGLRILGCNVSECISIESSAGGPSVDCIQAVPYSYLCSGDVDKFVAYYVGSGVIGLA